MTSKTAPLGASHQLRFTGATSDVETAHHALKERDTLS